ncbi:MAG: putative toxin-antitoxin system toxin component, PIN family [Nitrosomonas sp.]|uniref:putative toxin-antitoxin system toxin component, PIN family n=1 Tax=Nitrosomonas sp. TaxID=42353 RepID=UPI002B3ADD39|nr:putative toxin-antitoxin system toxin component, PIN family [Nitrosomonas sp.]MEB2331558.1 putative toxin-antitoxin system toxin component, PIN family [Nitrosomonas sp.]
MPGLSVVLDTSVLVLGLAYPASIPGRIVNAWRQSALNVVLSHYILDEMIRVLPRLSRIQMTPAEIRDLANSFMFLANVAEPQGSQDSNLRDSGDQPVLLTLITAQTDYLVTGDKDLLALARDYPIVTPAEFWSRHGE